MQRRGRESGGRGISKYSKENIQDSQVSLSSAAELIQSALMSKKIARKG